MTEIKTGFIVTKPKLNIVSPHQSFAPTYKKSIISIAKPSVVSSTIISGLSHENLAYTTPSELVRSVESNRKVSLSPSAKQNLVSTQEQYKRSLISTDRPRKHVETISVKDAPIFTYNPVTKSLGDLYTNYIAVRDNPSWDVVDNFKSNVRRKLGASYEPVDISMFDKLRGVTSIISEAPSTFTGNIAKAGSRYQIKQKTKYAKLLEEGKYDFIPGWVNPQLEKQKAKISKMDVSFEKSKVYVERMDNLAFGSAKVTTDLASYFIPSVNTPVKFLKGAKITGDLLGSSSPKEVVINIGVGTALGFGGKGIKEGANILLSKKGIPVVKSIFATTKLVGKKTLPLAMGYLAGKETDKVVKLYEENVVSAEKERRKLVSSFAGFNVGQPFGKNIYNKTIGMLTQNPNIIITKQTIPYREPYNVADQVLNNDKVNLARVTKTSNVRTILYRDPGSLKDKSIGKPGAFATIDYPGSEISRVGSYFVEKGKKISIKEAIFNPQSVAIQKLTNVKTAKIPVVLKNKMLSQLKTKGYVSDELIKQYANLVQKQAIKSKVPIAMLSPKTLTGSPEMENEIFLLFPKSSVNKPIYKLPSSKLLGLTKKESVPIYETKFKIISKNGLSAVKVNKSLDIGSKLFGKTNIERNLMFKKNLIDDWSQIVNTKYAQITGKAPRIPTAFETEKHGTQHFKNVYDNLKKIDFEGIKLSDHELKLMAKLHDTGKIGASSYTNWEHGDITAQVLKAGKFKNKDFTNLPKFKKDLIINAIKTHSTIKPVKFIKSPKADISDLPGIFQGIFGTAEQKALATADRLDLIRFNIKPSPIQLFTGKAKIPKSIINKTSLKIFDRVFKKPVINKNIKQINNFEVINKYGYDKDSIKFDTKAISYLELPILKKYSGRKLVNSIKNKIMPIYNSNKNYGGKPKTDVINILLNKFPPKYNNLLEDKSISYIKSIKVNKHTPIYKLKNRLNYLSSYKFKKPEGYIPSYSPKKPEGYVPSYSPKKPEGYVPSYSPKKPEGYVPSYSPKKPEGYIPSYSPKKPEGYVPSYEPEYKPYEPTYPSLVIKRGYGIGGFKGKSKIIKRTPKSTKGSFGVEVRKAGIWTRVGNLNDRHNKNSAISLGIQETSNSPARSFRLIPLTGKVNKIKRKVPKTLSRYYKKKGRGNKKLANAYIEKPKFAIDSKAEIDNITKVGWKTNRELKKQRQKQKSMLSKLLGNNRR